MKGKELIKWIQKNHAEDLDCIVQYRDSGGNYSGGEILDPPALATYKRDKEGNPYNVDIVYDSILKANCIVL